MPYHLRRAHSRTHAQSGNVVVVFDNLPADKVTGVREAIAARQAQVFYLPPYSLDMNPIKMAFSKLKLLPRQTPARMVDTLVNHIGSLLDRFAPNQGPLTCIDFTRSGLLLSHENKRAGAQ